MLSGMDLVAAQRLAEDLLAEHGPRGWSFAFDRAKVRAGACHHGESRISLSRDITRAHDPAEVRETLLHEIAHALVGPRHGHDGVWRARAIQIGATGRRCYQSDHPVVPGRWQGRCAAGHEVHRHRRPTRVLVCTRCRGLPALERVITWSHDGSPVPEAQLGPAVRATMEHLRRLG